MYVRIKYLEVYHQGLHIDVKYKREKEKRKKKKVLSSGLGQIVSHIFFSLTLPNYLAAAGYLYILPPINENNKQDEN